MLAKHGPTWQPRDEDYKQVLLEQNPWQINQNVPDVWAHKIERPLAGSLWRRLQADEPHRFQLVLGPRRVGKTTCLYQTVRNLLRDGVSAKRLWWLRLDHPLLMAIPLERLGKWVLKVSHATKEQPVYLFLDELNYAAEWDLWLKTFYDDAWPVRIAGSSSSTAALRNRRVESGVGRWEEQYLAPYLFTEFLELSNAQITVPRESDLSETIRACIRSDLSLGGLDEQRRKFILTGGFPELLNAANKNSADETYILLQSQRILRNDAVERAIYKDIPQVFGVDNPMMLERVLYTLAGQLAGVLSPNTICQNLNGLSQPTFDRYLKYLERAFLVFTLPNYSGSEASKQKRGRKLYFVDGAVRNAALQRGIAPLSDTSEMGLLTENLVAGHLHALCQQTHVRLYFWRDKNDEIDLIYDHPQSPIALEIASSASHPRKGIHLFMERFPRFNGRCYLAAPQIAPTLPESNWDKVGTIPLDMLLLAIGAQTELELAARLASKPTLS